MFDRRHEGFFKGGARFGAHGRHAHAVGKGNPVQRRVLQVEYRIRASWRNGRELTDGNRAYSLLPASQLVGDNPEAYSLMPSRKFLEAKTRAWLALLKEELPDALARDAGYFAPLARGERRY